MRFGVMSGQLYAITESVSRGQMLRKTRRSDSETAAVAASRILSYSEPMKAARTSNRVRARLKEELHARDISQRELADALSKQTDEYWTQSKVGKVLNGNVELKVDDADAIAKVAGIFLTEAVRDRGLEFYAEMTPLELRVLERIRQRPTLLHGLLMILDMAPTPRAVKPDRPKRGGPLLSQKKQA